ncbi:signal transduction histidine kinase [Desulfohalotomaculum tongense]|uniref:ATP-binding protein n=1 Tax=Desulforadius tongensis TaxID=1216062 RepID=UPI00195E06E0|nr:ATP-binding protein [Desulforadius tongensis]MBM7853933.1 signal transduction histidine kinase [Desulforadius tongensis]
MKSIKRRLVFQYCIIIFLTVLILESLFIGAVRQFYYGSVEEILVNRATVSANFYNRYLPDYNRVNVLKDKAKYILENTARDEPAKIEVLDCQGNVIVNSSGFTSNKKVDTPDFKAALKGETGVWKGKSEDTGERIIAVSNPLTKNDGRIVGVLRYVASMEKLHQVVTEITTIALAVGLLVVLLAVAVSLLLARSIIVPLDQVTSVAEQMAKGNFSIKAAKYEDDEIGKLADTLNYMSDEIVKADKIKNDFLSSISHELRTPLTSIKGWGETLLSGKQENKEEAREGLRIICKEADRMIELVEDLLDFSRFQSGRIKIHFEKVNINQIVEEVSHQFVIKAREKNIHLQVNLDRELQETTGDFNRLKQVLINLLDNAVKFTPEKGEIVITTTGCPEAVKIEVADTGEGIAPHDLPRLTEKFYKANANRPGSGLGLSITSEIVKLHGGKMNIKSTPGRGTKVTVVLPANYSVNRLSSIK